VIVVVCVGLLFGFAVGRWALRFQLRAARLLDPEQPPVRPAAPAPKTAVARSTGGATAVLLEAPAPPIVGWPSLRIVSWVVFDGTVLIACRRPEARRRTRRARFAPTIQPADQVLSLRFGDDWRADQALSMLADWRRNGAVLSLRPTDRPGAIELRDAQRNAVRAPLING
jgi:hypothetical protein